MLYPFFPGIEIAVALLILDVVVLGLVTRSAFHAPGTLLWASPLSWLALGLSCASLFAAAAYWSFVTGGIEAAPYVSQHMEIVDWVIDGTWFDDLVVLPWAALVLLQGGTLMALLGRARQGRWFAVLLSTTCLTSATVLLLSLASLGPKAACG